ncbi:hypothetical protein [Kitasatospora indigofera]|uniref:hypothetical protein n=1 Tax=Kitasatospora indigofera TaxID=67307 RepID=UPI0033B999A6
MKRFKKAMKAGAVSAAAVILGTGTAQAADGGGLLSLLNTPSLTLACFPSGQVGQGNSFTGTQNVSCSQSASQSAPTPNGNVVPTYTRNGDSVLLDPGELKTATASCLPGDVMTGGGYALANTDLHVLSSTGSTPNEWVVEAVNTGSGTGVPFFATVVCQDY